jgi:hypothetical protein
MNTTLTRLFQCHKQWTLLAENPHMSKFEAFRQADPDTNVDFCHGCAICQLGLDLYPDATYDGEYFDCETAHKQGFECPLSGYAWELYTPDSDYSLSFPCTEPLGSLYTQWTDFRIWNTNKAKSARAMVDAIEDCIADHLNASSY